MSFGISCGERIPECACCRKKGKTCSVACHTPSHQPQDDEARLESAQLRLAKHTTALPGAHPSYTTLLKKQMKVMISNVLFPAM